jgi:hypothetical protein
MAFPLIPWGTLGWRMGLGESYFLQWQEWYEPLSEHAKQTYQLEWPEREGWLGFYETLAEGTLPAWFFDREQLWQAAAGPITPDETLVVSYFRVVWLVRHVLELVQEDELEAGEVKAAICAAPDGSRWRFSCSKASWLTLTRLSPAT